MTTTTKSTLNARVLIKILNYHTNLSPYIKSLGTVILCTMICIIAYPFLEESNFIMVYLLGITILSLSGHTGASIAASFLSILAYDFFFINPFYSVSIDHNQYFFTLLVMLTVTLIISHLITQFKRNTELVKDSQLEAETERFRNILLTSISHDLKTPLTAILGSASNLIQSGNQIDEEIKNELAQNIYEEAERLNQLVINILQIIKLEAGTILISKQHYALEEVIGTALNRLNKRLENTPIHFHLPHNAPLVPLDARLIDQVLYNLIENAIKFSPPGAQVELSMAYNSKIVTIKIKDHGYGIKQEDLHLIFDKFYQGGKPESKGSGLGLAICKEIIQAHHGKIWAELNKDQGTTFYFTLPLEQKC